MPDSVSVFEAVDFGQDFVLTDLNPAAEKLDNIRREAVLGKSVSDVIVDATESGLVDMLRRVWLSGNPETMPVQLEQSSGALRWCEISVSKLPDTGHIVVVCDNTRGFRGLVDQLFGFIAMFSTSGQLIYANEAPLSAANLTLNDVIGKPFWETYWWSHSKKMQEKVRDSLERAAKGEFVRGEYEVRVGDTERIHTDGAIGPLRDAQGNITRLCAFGVDITGQKKAEERVRETQVRLAEVFQIAPEAVISIDEKMNVQDFNEAAERVYGYSAAEIIGRPMALLMPERFRDQHVDHVDSFLERSEYYRLMDARQDVTGLRKDGSEFPAAASVSQMEVNDKLVLTVVLRDVTEQRLAQEALMSAKADAERANRAKSTFLAAMGHELRTPLNAIIGFSEIMEDESLGTVGSAQYREYSADIRASGQHLPRLINDILEFSRIKSGSGDLHEDEIRIGSIVDNAVNEVKESAEKKGITLHVSIPEHLPKLLADESKVVRVLVNLLSNATKFSERGQEVRVKANCVLPAGHRIEVIDLGIGIAEEQISEAMKSFGQVDADLNRQYEGAGLGLPLSKAFMNMHGGELELKSALGVGTTVAVQFPPERTIE